MRVTKLGRLAAMTAAAALTLGIAMPAARAAAADLGGGWAVLQRWKLGGEGGWDYLTLDAAGKRLFISRGDRVDVLDTANGRIVATLPGMKGVHGIALAPDLKRGYVSNGKGDSVSVFDLDTLQVIREVALPAHNPDAILYEPAGRHVYTFNGRSKDVTVLDAAGLGVVATLPVPDKPEFAVDDGAGQVFVNIESEAGQIVVIDSRKLAVKATWPLPGCATPSGLALDNVHHRLFSVCDARVMVVTDAVTGKQVAKLPIGDEPDAAAYDAGRGLVWSSNGGGTLTAVRQESADRYSVAATIDTRKGARTMALDPASGRIYLVTADFGPLPPATPDQPHPRRPVVPGTFTVLVVGPR